MVNLDMLLTNILSTMVHFLKPGKTQPKKMQKLMPLVITIHSMYVKLVENKELLVKLFN